MSMQDTASGVALWRQVADGIERGIADGRFAAGEKLPGENEIAETYRVNRHTVRRALATLAERGLVRAERGSGTYVEAPRLAYPLRSRTRFSEIVGAGGREPDGRLIASSEELASRELARLLGLKTGAPLIRIEALRLADRTPICVSTNWFDAERFPDAAKIYERVRSVTKLLAHYGIRDYRREFDPCYRRHRRRNRRRATRSCTGTSNPRGRQHRCRYGRKTAPDQAHALCRRTRRVRG